MSNRGHLTLYQELKGAMEKKVKLGPKEKKVKLVLEEKKVHGVLRVKKGELVTPVLKVVQAKMEMTVVMQQVCKQSYGQQVSLLLI